MADGQVVIQVKSNANQTAKDFDKLDKSLDNTGKGLKQVDRQADKTSDSLKGLKNAITAVALFQLGKDAVNAGIRMTALTNKFNAAAGSIKKGGDSLEFVRNLTEELGLAFETTAGAYSGFVAAATRSGLSFAQTEQIFKDVATAATSLHLSSERVGLVFTALEQISSKGVVSMEELRRQLGDSLPGAFEIAAKSMGKTTVEFNKMISNGEVISKDFLPKFARAIREELGGSAEEASNSLQASFNRLQTSLFELKAAFMKEGGVITTSLKGWAEAATIASDAITDLFKDKTPIEQAKETIADTTTELNNLKVGLEDARKTFESSFTGKFIEFEDTGIFGQAQERIADATKRRAEAQALLNRELAFQRAEEEKNKESTDGNVVAVDNVTNAYKNLTVQLKNAKTAYLDALASQEATSDELLVLEGNYLGLKDAVDQVKQSVDNASVSMDEESIFNKLSDDATALRQELLDLAIQGQEDPIKAEQYQELVKQIDNASDSIQGFRDAAKDSFDFTGKAADAFSRNAARSLFEPWEEGETAAERFKSIAIESIKDILAEFIAAQIKKQAIAFATAIFTGGTSFFGGAAATGATAAAASAKGNAFNSGGKVNKFANGGVFTNSIVSQPTFFKTGDGANNVMGEAGAEAVMPLNRDSNGKLGVDASGMSPQINVINNTPAQITTVSRTENQFDIIVNQVSAALANSGTSQGFTEAVSRNTQVGAYAI